MRFGVLASSLIAAVALCACGGATGTTTTVTTGQTTAPSTGTTSETSTATAPTTSATTTPRATVTPRCAASRLALSFLGQQGATGHGEIGFALRNVGASSCRTFGYPGVLFVDRNGRPLPTSSTRSTRDFFGSAPATQLILAPGASASFRLGVTHGINSSAGCTTAYGVQVIPPDDTATLRTAIAQGAYECGTTTVSPLRPGSSAYP